MRKLALQSPDPLAGLLKEYHWGQNDYNTVFCLGELFSVIIAGNFIASNMWGIFNVMQGLVMFSLGNHE